VTADGNLDDLARARAVGEPPSDDVAVGPGQQTRLEGRGDVLGVAVDDEPAPLSARERDDATVDLDLRVLARGTDRVAPADDARDLWPRVLAHSLPVRPRPCGTLVLGARRGQDRAGPVLLGTRVAVR